MLKATLDFVIEILSFEQLLHLEGTWSGSKSEVAQFCNGSAIGFRVVGYASEMRLSELRSSRIGIATMHSVSTSAYEKVVVGASERCLCSRRMSEQAWPSLLVRRYDDYGYGMWQLTRQHMETICDEVKLRVVVVKKGVCWCLKSPLIM